MSRFTSPLRLEDTGVDCEGRVIFRILDSFDYEVGAEGSGIKIRVPAGFETDFASVPRFFWRLLPPWGRYGKAAVLHDFLYRKASGFSKVVGDAIFYEAMELLDVPWWKRYVMFLAVSYFGHSSYHWESPAAPDTEVKMLEPDEKTVKQELPKCKHK